MIVISSLIIFFTFGYVILILLLWSGFLNLTGNNSVGVSGDDLFISVLVPFRNEADGLPALIRSFSGQSRSPALFELIFIDDHSTDGSAEIVGEACRTHPNFKLYQLPGEAQGKKSAIAHGVSRARGSYVIQTDADSWVRPDFIEAHALKIKATGADLIAGPVTCAYRRQSLMDVVETIDYMSLTGTGAGSFFYDDPIMCSGANLCFRTSLYKESVKFDPAEKTPSGDDMFLLMAAKRMKKNIVYLKSRDALVYTKPAGNLKSFLRQRIRWGSKARYYSDRSIIGIALLVFLTHFILLVSPLAILYRPDLWKVIILCLGMKSITDLILLLAVGKFTGQAVLLWFYPLVAVLHYFYFVYTSIASLFFRVHWRGRIY